MSESPKKIVRVDVSKTLLGESTWRVKYAILCDRSVAEIIAYADANPRVVVFPFATKGIDDLFDYSPLMESPLVDKYGDDIVQPTYVGNFHHIGSAIQQIVKISFGPYYKDADCVLNEWVGEE